MSVQTVSPTTFEDYYKFEEISHNATRLGRLLSDAYMSMDNYSQFSQHAEGWLQSLSDVAEFSLAFRHPGYNEVRGYMTFSFDADAVRFLDRVDVVVNAAQRFLEAQKLQTLEIRCFRQFGMRGFINAHPDGTWELFLPTTPGEPYAGLGRMTPRDVLDLIQAR